MAAAAGLGGEGDGQDLGLVGGEARRGRSPAGSSRPTEEQAIGEDDPVGERRSNSSALQGRAKAVGMDRRERARRARCRAARCGAAGGGAAEPGEPFHRRAIRAAVLGLGVGPAQVERLRQGLGRVGDGRRAAPPRRCRGLRARRRCCASTPRLRHSAARSAAPEPTSVDRARAEQPRPRRARSRDGAMMVRPPGATAWMKTWPCLASIAAAKRPRVSPATRRRKEADRVATPTAGMPAASADSARGGDADAKAGIAAGADRHRDPVEARETALDVRDDAVDQRQQGLGMAALHHDAFRCASGSRRRACRGRRPSRRRGQVSMARTRTVQAPVAETPIGS